MAALSGFALLTFGCASAPPVEQYVLERAGSSPIRIASAQGPLNAAQSKAILDRLKSTAPDSGIFEKHLAIEETLAGSPLSVGNKAILLQDGPATYQAMFEAIRSAKDHILLEMYIFEDDDVGKRFAKALVDKRKQGVPVNLLYDAVGSMQTPPEFFQALKDAGVKVAAYNPVNPLKAKKGWEINERNHRKLLVVDGRVAFLGGINISDVYSSSSMSRGSTKFAKKQEGKPEAKRPWRDTQVQIEGPAVAELQKTFFEAWSRTETEAPELKKMPVPPKAVGREAVRTVAGWGNQPVNAIYATFLSAISSSETSIHMTMAYFVPDPQTVTALKDAAKRGVDVRLVLPGFTDFWAVFHAGRSHYDDLLSAGVKIYERKDRLLHSKTVVIDGVWSTVGSANVDWRSFVHNNELNVVILGTDFGAQMEAQFEKELRASEEITKEKWSRRPFKDRMREMGARVWEYWL